jgi:hypothetical protein
MKKLLKKVAVIGISALNLILLFALRLVYVIVLSLTFVIVITLVIFAGSQTGVKYLNDVSTDILSRFRKPPVE